MLPLQKAIELKYSWNVILEILKANINAVRIEYTNSVYP